MDPDEVIHRCSRALDRNDCRDALSAIDDYLGWRARDGYAASSAIIDTLLESLSDHLYRQRSSGR